LSGAHLRHFRASEFQGKIRLADRFFGPNSSDNGGEPLEARFALERVLVELSSLGENVPLK